MHFLTKKKTNSKIFQFLLIKFQHTLKRLIILSAAPSSNIVRDNNKLSVASDSRANATFNCTVTLRVLSKLINALGTPCSKARF